MRERVRGLALFFLLPSVGACTGGGAQPPEVLAPGLRCEGNTLSARVAAIPQHFAINRLGSDVPDGLMFALESDLDSASGQLRPDLRPRPLTLRVEAGQCLNITLRNATEEAVSLHADGVQWRSGARDDGSHIGENPDSTVTPGQTATYTLYAEAEGTFLFYSLADDAHRERGLFGALNVEPAGSQWYRSQLTAAELALASAPGEGGLPTLRYDAVYPEGHALAGRPILDLRQGGELVHGDLSALVVPAQGEAFRELTAIYHDFDAHVRQAFGQIHDPKEGPDLAERQALAQLLSAYSDRYAVNYGGAGVANKVIANRLGMGPMGRCTTCRFEEFALSSWVSGDPALLVDRPVWAAGEGGGPTSAPGAEAVALYPADPSNVLHSYLGDPVRFRVLQGAGEDVVVHHQHGRSWARAADGQRVDSEPLGSGLGITVSLSGSLAPGDSLLHAEDASLLSRGMWAVWRTHDVLELGSRLGPSGHPVGRALPDGEIKAGTPIPAVVPLPDRAMPPLPGEVLIDREGQVFWEGEVPRDAAGQPASPGYPFFIPGVAGSRPPQPPLELVEDGGLPRHVVRPGRGMTAFELSWQSLSRSTPILDARALAADGEPIEKLAMAFHASGGVPSRTPSGAEATFLTSGQAPAAGAPYADPCGAEDPQRVYRTAQVGHDLLLTKSGWHVPQGRLSLLWEDVLPTLSHERVPQPLTLRAHVGDCVVLEHTNLLPAERDLDDFAARSPSDIVGQHAHLVDIDLTASAGVAGGFNYEDGALSPEEVRRRINAINTSPQRGGRGGLLTTGGRRVQLRASSHPYFGARSTYASHGSLSGLAGVWAGAQTVVQRWHVGEGVTVGAIEELYTPGRSRAAGLVGGLLAEPAGSIWWDPVSNRRLSQILKPGEARHPVSLRLDGGPTSWQARVEVPSNPADGYREFALTLLDDQPAYQAGLGYPAERGARTDLRGAQFLTGTDDQNRDAAVLLAGTSCTADTAKLSPCPLDASTGGAVTINYRAEPLALRTAGTWTDDGGVDPTDPAGALLSVARPNFVGHPAYATLATQTPRAPSLRMGGTRATVPPLGGPQGASQDDPYTPVLRAYMGEPVRMAVIADLADVSVHGVRWGTGTAAKDRELVGSSADVRFTVPYAEEAERADHLYAIATDGLALGSWGVLRAYHTLQAGLDPVSVYPPAGEVRVPTCPEDAPLRDFTVWATPLDGLPPASLTYRLVSEVWRSSSRSNEPQTFPGDVNATTGAWTGGTVRPLVLRARAGECIRVTLVNKLEPVAADLIAAGVSAQVGLRPQLLALDASDDSGFNVGQNPVQTVGPGGTIVYNWFAGANTVTPRSGEIQSTPVAVGAVNLLPPDPAGQVPRGLVGALVIEPADATWEVLDGDRTRARISSTEGTFDEAVLIHLDGLSAPEGCAQPRIASLNYVTRPGCADGEDLRTPAAVLPAAAGAPMRLRLLHPGVSGEVNFTLHGHLWPTAGGSRLDSRVISVGAGARSDIALQAAGGVYQIGGDYLFYAGDPSRGAWGVLRVSQPAAE